MAYLFTSESVSEGHPDKVADQISDGILDEFLKYDPNAKVACETFVTTGLVVIGGEIKTTAEAKAKVDVAEVARKVIHNIGYNKAEYMFDANSCGVLSAIHEQSADINRGVEREKEEDQGQCRVARAGNQQPDDEDGKDRPADELAPKHDRPFARLVAQPVRGKDLRQQPAAGPDRGGSADQDLVVGEGRGKGGQDGAGRGKRQTDAKENIVAKKRDPIAAQMLPRDRVVMSHRASSWGRRPAGLPQQIIPCQVSRRAHCRTTTLPLQ